VTNVGAFTTIRRAALMGSGLRSRIGRGHADGGVVGKPRFRMRARQDGQALVEFALIAPLLLMLVFGIIYFGIGLNYWLDMNRVANQGARQAAVNHWPTQCARTETLPCTSSTPTSPCATVMATNSKAYLQDVLRCQTRNNATATICFPGKTNTTATIGDPVKVKLTKPFRFFFMNSLSITLTGTATMRLEQQPTRFQASAGGPVCP
jgi:Flp pilus assembly protein TadG